MATLEDIVGIVQYAVLSIQSKIFIINNDDDDDDDDDEDNIAPPPHMMQTIIY